MLVVKVFQLQQLQVLKAVVIIKQASEAFYLVIKTNNCLRIRVLTIHLVYILNWHTCPHLANMSSPRIEAQVFQPAPPPLGYAHKISCAYHRVLKSIKSLDGDRGMDRCMPCLSKAFQ